MTIRAYSHLFSCMHDQPAPVGALGRGAHHSIFRSVQWRDVSGEPFGRGRIHDFGVIWDEDHDERVIRAAERLHLADLLWPVVFVGERKGTVTLLLDYMGAGGFLYPDASWLEKIRTVASAQDDDDWNVEIGMYHRMTVVGEDNQTDPKRIIAADHDRVIRYLQGIDALWQLGDHEAPKGLDQI